MRILFLWLLPVLLLLAPTNAFARRRPLVDRALSAVDDALTAAPRDNEVCFSPDENCDAKAWKFIQSATKSVEVAIYDITHPKIVHELLVASKKFPVRVVADQRQSKGTHSLASLLSKGGIEVRFGRQRGIMHNKFILVDGVRLMTGSFNLTNNASTNNNENQIYLSTPEIVGRYRQRFEKLWSEGKPAKQELSRQDE